jgi:hypothetical protein
VELVLPSLSSVQKATTFSPESLVWGCRGEFHKGGAHVAMEEQMKKGQRGKAANGVKVVRACGERACRSGGGVGGVAKRVRRLCETRLCNPKPSFRGRKSLLFELKREKEGRVPHPHSFALLFILRLSLFAPTSLCTATPGTTIPNRSPVAQCTGAFDECLQYYLERPHTKLLVYGQRKRKPFPEAPTLSNVL